MYKLFDSSNVPEDRQVSISLESRYENDFVKTASKRDLPKEVDEAIKNLKRKKDHSYVLVTAMGDGETWGENKNGDYFPYDGLMGVQNTPVWGEMAGKDERLNSDKKNVQRYLTFQDASFFKHHRNKIERDPHFGYVPASIWNPKMRTVLLIIGVDRNKDPENAAKIDRNELINVSMGAKLPWDRCSICHKKHKSVSEYCNHLKFQMHKIMPDGRRAYAENLFPRFFDISDVTRPAFLAGQQLEKIAYQMGDMLSVDLAEIYDIGRFDKLAEVEKKSALYKQIPAHVEGAIAKVCDTEKDLPHAILNDLAKLKPQQAWGALTNAGIIAKPNEFAYILLKHEGHDELASKFVKAKAVVKNPDIKGLDENLHSIADIHLDHTAKNFARNIPGSIIEERSIGCINDRVYATEKGLRKEAEIVSTIGLGSIMSALYLLYRNNAEQHFSAYGLLGAGISQVIRDDEHNNKYVGNNPFATEELNKHASTTPFLQSGKGMVLRGLTGFALPYIGSAYYQNKMMNGEQVGTMGRFIANNPGKIGLIGGAALVNPTAMYNGVKKVSTDLLSGKTKK